MAVGAAGVDTLAAVNPVGVVHSREHDPVPILVHSMADAIVQDCQRIVDYARQTPVQVTINMLLFKT